MTILNVWDERLAGSESSDPSIAYLLYSLLGHKFTFQYIRLVRTRSGGPDNSENDEGIIEIAWMTAPTVQEAREKQEYSGPDPGNIFFVLHLHFDHFARSQDTAREYVPAVYAMTAFHGQAVDQSARSDVLGRLAGHVVNRVDGQDAGGANARVRILGTDEHRPTGAGGQATFLRLLHDLGHHIRSEGYTDADRLHRVWGADEDQRRETMELSWRAYITSGDSGSFVLNGSPWQPPAGVPTFTSISKTRAKTTRVLDREERLRGWFLENLGGTRM